MTIVQLATLANQSRHPRWNRVSSRGRNLVEPMTKAANRTILAQCCKPGCTPCQPKKKCKVKRT